MAIKDKAVYNAYMKQYMLDRYNKRRYQAIVDLGGKCVKCSSIEALNIHHIDPSTKSFTLASGSSCSNDRWNAEIAKCELLCRECHINHHRSKELCGTPQKYWRGCRCASCTRANTDYGREYKRKWSLNRETD